MEPHFSIPLNLPHAAVVAGRIEFILSRMIGTGPSLDGSRPSREAVALAGRLFDLLAPIRAEGENPVPPEDRRVADQAASLARRLVDAIDRGGLGGDRLGQCARNLFECLELGEEGALMGLKAGEDPASLQRPA